MKRVWHWVAAKRPLELACCGACSVVAPGVDVHKYAGHPRGPRGAGKRRGEAPRLRGAPEGPSPREWAQQLIRRDVRAATSRFQCPMPNALISESLTAVNTPIALRLSSFYYVSSIPWNGGVMESWCKRRLNPTKEGMPLCFWRLPSTSFRVRRTTSHYFTSLNHCL